jgi:hypothetical protein
MPLPKKANTGTYEKVMVNVYDLATKEIVFTGGQKEAAQFMGINPRHMSAYLSSKSKVKRKYAVRMAKEL